MTQESLQHELISAVKNLAIELGRTPTFREFEARTVGGKYRVQTHFGNFTLLLQAAGLDTYGERRSEKKLKISDSIFERDVDRHLEEYVPRPAPDKKPWPKIAILGDIHEPFGHDGVKSEFKLFCEREQPDYIVQVGDAVDFYSHSKFPRSHNVFTPKDEESSARRRLEELWSELGKAAPKAKKVMLLGNHAIRPIKRILEAVPSLEHWAEKYLADYLSFPGVETVLDPREEYKIADISFVHGWTGGVGKHRDYLMTNVVLGHLHVGSVSFRNIGGRTLFELNAGLAGDPESKGLSYTPTKTVQWTLGYAAIDALGPRFIPYR